MAIPQPRASQSASSGRPNSRQRRHPVSAGYVGIPEAARYLDVDHKTIRRLIAASKLPAYRLGNRVIKIKVSDLDAVLTPLQGGGAA